MKKVTLSVLVIFMLGFLVFAENSEIRIVSWNVESGGASTKIIAKQIADSHGIDLWGLSEVPPRAKKVYRRAAKIGENSNFKGFMSKQGRGDRLMIIYNSDKFTLRDQIELEKFSFGNRVRPALVGLFEEKKSGESFYFMVNHLYRGSKEKRKEQSRMLKKWAIKNKRTPIIMVGDYNYDWDIKSSGEKRDPGFDILTGALKWIEPKNKILTQCSDKDKDRKCNYNSILDFIFVNPKAAKWKWNSKIVILDGEFFPHEKKSDHRPVAGRFVIATE